jgi:hypothetical protein
MPPEVNTRLRGERGNMIVAVGVMMILAMLSAAVVARTLAGLRSTKQGEDFSAALAHADAGVSDALFRVDQQGIAPAASFCVGDSSGCTVKEIPGSPGTEYVATRVDDNTYLVKSKGIVNGRPHAAQATITRSYTFPFAIFAKTVLDFNGNPGNYDPNTCTGPVQTVDEVGNTVCFPYADVATNGQISCRGSTSPARQQDYYKGGGTNCQNGYLLPGTYNPQDPSPTCPAPPNVPTTPCLPDTYNPCPAIAGVLPAVLLPGVYYCNELDLGGGKSPKLSFPPVFAVGAGSDNDGVVEIFVIPTDDTNITVSIANADVNLGGDPTKLRVYLAGGTVDPGSGIVSSGDFTGIMWAPNAVEQSPSCNANWRGAVVVNAFTCDGGPHLEVRYDTRMLNLVETVWTVTNYTEIPSGQVDLF